MAHFYGQSPLDVENWDSDKLATWYNEAIKLHNKLNEVKNRDGKDS